MARWGGRKADRKTHVKDIDRHGQNLRQIISADGLEFWGKPDKQEEPAKAGCETHGYSNETPVIDQDWSIGSIHYKGTQNKPTPWGITVLPGDFARFDFTELGEDARLMACVNDDCLLESGATPTFTPMGGNPPIRQAGIDTRLENNNVDIHHCVSPSVKNALLKEQRNRAVPGETIQPRSLRDALESLTTEGCRADDLFPRVSQLPINRPTIRRNRAGINRC